MVLNVDAPGLKLNALGFSAGAALRDAGAWFSEGRKSSFSSQLILAMYLRLAHFYGDSYRNNDAGCV